MSSGETLLLLPAQRCLDLLPQRLPMGSTKRCLFGGTESASNAVAEELAQELERERMRVIRKWDFDPATGMPVVPAKRYPWEAVCPGGERVNAATASQYSAKIKKSRRRDRVTPYKPLRITDFWRVKKCDSLIKESGQQQPREGESSFFARAEREQHAIRIMGTQCSILNEETSSECEEN